MVRVNRSLIDETLLDVRDCTPGQVCISARPYKGEPGEEEALNAIGDLAVFLRRQGVRFRELSRHHWVAERRIHRLDCVIFPSRHFI